MPGSAIFASASGLGHAGHAAAHAGHPAAAMPPHGGHLRILVPMRAIDLHDVGHLAVHLEELVDVSSTLRAGAGGDALLAAGLQEVGLAPLALVIEEMIAS